jgi:hypothetical protein
MGDAVVFTVPENFVLADGFAITTALVETLARTRERAMRRANGRELFCGARGIIFYYYLSFAPNLAGNEKEPQRKGKS